MADIKVLGGSVPKQLRWELSGDYILSRDGSTFSQKVINQYPIRAMDELALANEATGVKVLGAVGWGALGTLIAGPVGALVGGILGGRGKTVTFVGKFKDGKTIVGQVSDKTWVQMLAKRY